MLKASEDEKYDRPGVSDQTATLYEHCLRAIERAMAFGIHGLPLIGSGDWNDGMNKIGQGGRGESVWLGWFIISVLKGFAPICRMMGDTPRAKKYTETADRISKAIEKSAWDGEWYQRAYFDDGKPLGSKRNDECKIDSIAQSWAVISGEGDPERDATAMDSIDTRLIDQENGIIKLFAPPFDHGELDPGYIRGYLQGVRENGGQYTHAAAWAIMAWAMLGNGNKAWEYFELINPINHTRNVQECSKYKLEPYVVAADVYAAHPYSGRGGWSWYTGSASWLYKTGLENILGFKKNRDTLTIDPCISSKWAEYAIQYKYISTLYKIRVHNPEGVSKGVVRISLDGNAMEGNAIRLVDDGAVHDVVVVMAPRSIAVTN